MATHSSILAWRIPWTEEPDRLHSPWGLIEADTAEHACSTMLSAPSYGVVSTLPSVIARCFSKTVSSLHY